MLRCFIIFFYVLFAVFPGVAQSVEVPKREFRGAWMQTVYQDSYAKRSTDENKRWLCSQLDALQEAGINAVIFQVRPSADAFYDSPYEPWSKFISVDGKPPRPYWDPLQFMVEQCHSRGMELHAWINPYRATTSARQKLPDSHPGSKHPERFISYDKRMYFDPGIDENREFIRKIVKDIVKRYDIDGIHFDDYFYPYPVKGCRFNDDKTFQKHGKGMSLADWRRSNIDKLIEELHHDIRHTKPWVRFGVSPFGIWRNHSSDPAGSRSAGLQNYDDLYADVLRWAREGWIDYQMPQLYWTLENKVAPSLHLAEWWADNACGRHVYIGQDVVRTMDNPDLAPSTDLSQLNHKVRITRENPSLQGSCFWPAGEITANHGGIADSLAADVHAFMALVPAYPWIDDACPHAPRNVAVKGHTLQWESHAPKGHTNDATRFVVYCFDENDEIDLGDPSAIIAVTPESSYKIPEEIPRGSIFVVTALNRVNNESEPGQPFVTY